jgi:hypothetical protein
VHHRKCVSGWKEISGGQEVYQSGNDRGEDNPDHLIPVKERDAEQNRIFEVVKGGDQQKNERDNEEEKEPTSALLCRTSNHISLLDCWMTVLVY